MLYFRKNYEVFKHKIIEVKDLITLALCIQVLPSIRYV